MFICILTVLIYDEWHTEADSKTSDLSDVKAVEHICFALLNGNCISRLTIWKVLEVVLCGILW